MNQLPIERREKELIAAVSALKNNAEIIGKYQRLRSVYHINLDDRREAAMDWEKKIEYMETVIALLESFSADYEQLEKLHQSHLKYARQQPHMAKRVQKSLQKLHAYHIEKTYSLRSFLAWLGTLEIPVWDPISFFTEKHQELQSALSSLQRIQPVYRNKMQTYSGGGMLGEILREIELEMNNSRYQNRSRQRSSNWGRPSSRRSSGGWGGSFGSVSVFSGGGFGGSGSFKGGW